MSDIKKSGATIIGLGKHLHKAACESDELFMKAMCESWRIAQDAGDFRPLNPKTPKPLGLMFKVKFYEAQSCFCSWALIGSGFLKKTKFNQI